MMKQKRGLIITDVEVDNFRPARSVSYETFNTN